MIFWICLLLLIIFALLCGSDLFDMLGALGIIIDGFVVVIMVICIIIAHANADGYIAENQSIYESLVYQYENNIYDNDNDLGKRELMTEIQEWNSNLAYRQAIEDNFWLGIFYPNVHDQFKFIELK